MPINKTKPGTFTIIGGSGKSSDPYVWDAIVSENDRTITRSLTSSESDSDGLWVKVYCSPNTTYEFWWNSNSDGDLSVYNQEKQEMNWWDHNFTDDYRGYHCNEKGSYTTGSNQEFFYIRAGEYSYGRVPSDSCHLIMNPAPLEVIPKKIYSTSTNFDEQGYMVDFFSLEEAEIKAPVVAQGGLDFDLSFQNGLTESLTGITGAIEDSTYFEMANDEVVGNYLLCKKIRGSQKKVVFTGTENMFQYGTGNFTVSFWLKAPNFVGFGQSILSKHNGSTGFSIYNTVDNTSDTTMEMRVSQSNSNVDLSTNAVNESNWTHWLFMRENNTGYWYKNGTKIGQASMGERNVNNNSPLYLGFTNCAPYWGATFGITSLRIYGKSMKDFEITALSREFRI